MLRRFSLHRRKADSMGAVESPESCHRFISRGFPRLATRIDDEVRADLEELRAKIAELLPKAEGKVPRRRAVRWVLAVGYAGLECAGLVVVNVRGSDDRTRAAQITEERMPAPVGPSLGSVGISPAPTPSRRTPAA